MNRLNNKKKFKPGFTLLEVLIAVPIFTILFFVAVNLFLNIFTNPKGQTAYLDNVDQGRQIASIFVNEIRNATTANDGSFPLNQLTGNQIIFYSNYGSVGSSVNRIRYYISNNNFYKGVVIPAGIPLTYNLNSETVTTLITGLANGVTPVFYYYNGDYNGSGSQISEPVNVNQVKFIKINLIVPKQITANTTNNFLINTGATIRNLKNNLGN